MEGLLSLDLKLSDFDARAEGGLAAKRALLKKEGAIQ